MANDILIGGGATPLKNRVSWDDEIPNIYGKIKSVWNHQSHQNICELHTFSGTHPFAKKISRCESAWLNLDPSPNPSLFAARNIAQRMQRTGNWPWVPNGHQELCPDLYVVVLSIFLEQLDGSFQTAAPNGPRS